MKKILSLAATTLLILSTSHANAALTVYTNVTQKPVETITDTDVASELMNKAVVINTNVTQKPVETITDTDVASELMNKAVVINTNVTQKPGEAITDTDVASEAMNMEKATYHLLLDIGFTEEEAFMLLFFDSVTESGAVHESVYAEHEFE